MVSCHGVAIGDVAVLHGPCTYEIIYNLEGLRLLATAYEYHNQSLSAQAGKVLSIAYSRYWPVDQNGYASRQFAHCLQEGHDIKFSLVLVC